MADLFLSARCGALMYADVMQKMRNLGALLQGNAQNTPMSSVDRLKRIDKRL